jgi:hypothetical protein
MMESTVGRRFVDRYFAVWALVLPVTSVLIIPSVQGTTPGYLLALASLAVVPIIRPDLMRSFLGGVAAFFAIFVGLNAVAQLLVVFANAPPLAPLPLVAPFEADRTVFLRSSMFSQSLYLLAGVATLFFVRTFYHRGWDRYILTGAGLLAAYGIYEFIFFLLFGRSGDFLSNRVFVAGDLVHTGSWFQTLQVGPLTIARLKSLTGEPSMYAFAMLPFWIHAVHTGRTLLSMFLLATLLMSTATTAVVGLAVYGLVRLYYARHLSVANRYTLAFLVTLAILAVAAWSIVTPLLELLVLDKLALSSYSAVTRVRLLFINLEFFLQAPLVVQLFGVGFGYVRSIDMATTLLVNNGLVGVGIVTAAFFYPLRRLGNTRREIGLKAILVVLFVVMMVAVSEFAYLSVWLFLGIVYHEIRRPRHESLPAARAAVMLPG